MLNSRYTFITYTQRIQYILHWFNVHYRIRIAYGIGYSRMLMITWLGYTDKVCAESFRDTKFHVCRLLYWNISERVESFNRCVFVHT